MLADIAVTHQNVDYKGDFELLENIFEIWPQHKTDEDILFRKFLSQKI